MTRAFAKAFGHPPGRLRSLGPVSTMIRRKKASALEPEIHERVEQMPELHLAGVAFRATPANSQELPKLWRQLKSLRGFPGSLDSNIYVLLLNVDRRDRAVEMSPHCVSPSMRRYGCVVCRCSRQCQHRIRAQDSDAQELPAASVRARCRFIEVAGAVYCAVTLGMALLNALLAIYASQKTWALFNATGAPVVYSVMGGLLWLSAKTVRARTEPRRELSAGAAP